MTNPDCGVQGAIVLAGPAPAVAAASEDDPRSDRGPGQHDDGDAREDSPVGAATTAGLLPGAAAGGPVRDLGLVWRRHRARGLPEQAAQVLHDRRQIAPPAVVLNLPRIDVRQP